MLGSLILYSIIISLMIETNLVVFAQVSSTESSAEYLHNVMYQLQEQNRPLPVSDDKTSGPADDFTYYNKPQSSFHTQQQHENEVLQSDKSNIVDEYRRFLDNKRPQLLTEQSVRHHNDQQLAESVAHHYQVQAPQSIFNPIQMIKDPVPLGLTRNDLVMLYNKALAHGSTASLSALQDPLAASQVPQITGNQLRLNSGPPGYYYYFYPLKSFINEPQTLNAYKPIPHNIRPAKTDLVAESTEKQISNPLFMAMGSFIGMALLFMATILFFPRFDALGSRNTSDEFLQLTKVAWEAIEGRNCTERFACEINKFAVKLELSKRSRRLLEDVVPDNLRRQMIKMRRSSRKPTECKLITCKCA